MPRPLEELLKALLSCCVTAISFYTLGHLFLAGSKDGEVFIALTINLYFVVPFKWAFSYVLWRGGVFYWLHKQRVTWNAVVVAGIVIGIIALLCPPYSLLFAVQLPDF